MQQARAGKSLGLQLLLHTEVLLTWRLLRRARAPGCTSPDMATYYMTNRSCPPRAYWSAFEAATLRTLIGQECCCAERMEQYLNTAASSRRRSSSSPA
ncbi:MAG: hypothetical protein ACLUEK_17130 [Oscillospiraceae bacterium]